MTISEFRISISNVTDKPQYQTLQNVNKHLKISKKLFKLIYEHPHTEHAHQSLRGSVGFGNSEKYGSATCRASSGDGNAEHVVTG